MSDAHEKLLIGVDGGGTGCRAAVAWTPRDILAEAEGGPANVATDFDLAIANVKTTVDLAARKAGLDPQVSGQASIHIGLAGVISGEVAQRVAAALPFQSCAVTDDRPAAVHGALGGEDGFLLSVGTGTIAAACRAGRTDYVGGWGFYVSDQASGAWLGRGFLDHTLQCHDGVMEHSPLTRQIMTKFDNDPNRIVAFSVTAKPSDYGSLAPDIVAAAGAGDAVALHLMRTGSDYLERALGRLGYRPGDPLCLTGGVGRFYRAHLAAELTRNVREPRGSALTGALHLASAQLAVIS